MMMKYDQVGKKDYIKIMLKRRMITRMMKYDQDAKKEDNAENGDKKDEGGCRGEWG